MTMEREVPIELQVLVRQAYNGLMKQQNGVRRRGQQVMIGAITKAVVNAKKANEQPSGARLIAIEAPTGAGKSFAYGLGAIPVALANGLKVVISTGKVALQEQLIDKDLVALRTFVPEMKAVLVKGRSRYACVVRMREEARRHGEEGEQAKELLRMLDAGAWSGDVDDLAESPDPKWWGRQTNDRNGCVGRKCNAYDKCPYYKARNEADGANVIVTNHDLLLANARAGQMILPALEDTVLIVDEAHGLPEKAVESIAQGHTLDEARAVAEGCGTLAATVRRADRGGLCAQVAEQLVEALEMMVGTMSEARVAIGSLGASTAARDEKRPYRFRGGELPPTLKRIAAECLTVTDEAGKVLVELSERLRGDEGDGIHETVRENLLCEVGRASASMDRIASVWRLMTAEGGPDGEVAKWLEVVEGGDDLRVCASPVGVGSYLHETLWSKVAAAVHISGTLTTVGGMEPYLRQSGLDRTPGVKTLVIESPFNHEEQAMLIVPKDACSPKDVKGHTQWLIDSLPKMIESHPKGEGVLVLFASHRQMQEVTLSMPQRVKEILLTQAAMPKREVLARHGQAIASGKKSVIFGTAAYEEGVDLRGSLCSLVVLAKLQFMTPNNPVSEALKEQLEQKGRSFFDEVAVPAACRRLAQSSGRLLRTEQDRGWIVVADTRLTGTRYGRDMLAALPKYRLGRSIEAMGAELMAA